jgi:hypothetical protein
VTPHSGYRKCPWNFILCHKNCARFPKILLQYKSVWSKKYDVEIKGENIGIEHYEKVRISFTLAGKKKKMNDAIR